MNRNELKKVKAVVFDMDGLMFDSERIIQISWNIAGKELGYGSLGEDIYPNLGHNSKEREQYFLQKYGEEFPYELFHQTYRKAFDLYVNEHGLPAKKGLHELLAVLEQWKIKKAIATSSSYPYALAKLKQEHIEDRFEVIVTGDMITHSKPHPEIYQLACKKLEIESSLGVALEDSYNGIRSAANAGMMTIMVPDLIKESKPIEDLLTDKQESLLEVAKIFEEIWQK